MNNNSMQMLMDALARASRAAPSMAPNQWDLSNGYMTSGSGERDASKDVKPQGAIAKMGMLLAPNATQGMLGGGGSSMASMAAKGGAG